MTNIESEPVETGGGERGGESRLAPSPRRVAVGMSGGVDSALSAAVLLQAGYDVVGVTCAFVDDPATDASLSDAARVCSQLGIDHVARRCERAFEDAVVCPFVEQYAAGLTPSPCVVCNARVKLPELAAAADELGCDLIATGHFARIARVPDGRGEPARYAVLRALDNAKDQSYMLSMADQDLLGRLMLPLGGLTKTAVRLAAADLGLSVADKPESQDICFAPEGYRRLLAERGVEEEPGPIVDARGCVLGHHEGLSRYTIGQRKGIGVAGPAPYYVIAKNARDNELVVGFEEETLIRAVTVVDPVWQALAGLSEKRHVMVKLRYRSPAVACIIEPLSETRVRVTLETPQPTTAPGQFAVFSLGDTIYGAGMIEEVQRI